MVEKNGTDIPDYYETTTFSPDELDQVFLKQNEFLNNNFFSNDSIFSLS